VVNQPIRENSPTPGWYKRRLVRGGPFVPARIWWELAPREVCDECEGRGCWTCKNLGAVPTDDDRLRCEVAGQARDPYDEWTWLANGPISEAEYNLMRARAEWDRAHDRAAPSANPREAIDFLKVRPPW